MPPETLDFEEPIAVLLKEIEALELLPRTDARDREIELRRRRLESARGGWHCIPKWDGRDARQFDADCRRVLR